jgi:LysR family transcriptional regulator, cys regulon transcriptional activator
MKLQQLRYLVAVVQNDLNITAASRVLHTSQPGISKQLRLLEDELGFLLFERDGRTLTQVTPAGWEVTQRALKVLAEVGTIKRLSEEARSSKQGTLSIGTTHTQARYVLPKIMQGFRERYPDVQLHLHEGTSEQIAELAHLNRVDLVIATGSYELFPGMVHLPCYRWRHQIIVPKTHALAMSAKISLKELSRHPIVTYSFSFAGPSSLQEVFSQANLPLEIALTAQDADVIKTYVRLGFGAGIVASLAVDSELDPDLAVLEAAHLFPEQTSWVGFRQGTLLRGFMYDFMQQLAPHLTRRLINDAARLADPKAVKGLVPDDSVHWVHGSFDPVI